jgi:hypothetical protein
MVQTIIVLAEQGGRMRLGDPERYSRERITAFTPSLLDSVRGQWPSTPHSSARHRGPGT